MWGVALLEAFSHGCGGDVEGETASHHKHCGCLDIEKGEVAFELCIDDSAYLCKLWMQVVDITDDSAHSDGGADLMRFSLDLGFAEELLCFMIVGDGFVFFDRGVGGIR